MKLTSGKKLVKLVEGIISDEKQVNDLSVDLTVKEVYELHTPGVMDFGGGEYVESGKHKLEPVKAMPDDDFGWWHLHPGVYLVTLNETIDSIKGLGLMSPHPRLLKCGATHSTLVVHEWKSEYILPLSVGENGMEMKENSRISKLLVLK